MSLDASLTRMMKTDLIDYFGVADLSLTKDFIESIGDKLISNYPKAISIGIILPDSIVNELPRRTERAVAVIYRNIYDVTNNRLDIASAKISGLLQNEGYKAFPVPASERFDDEKIAAVFSHKIAAHQAGLGWIGKSCLLVTPESGPRVRWSTVLTDAPLKATGQPLKEQCGVCTECVDICPVEAFTGKSFREDEPREARYDARKCEKFIGHDDEELKICGLCIYVCPHGRKTNG